MNGGQDLSLTTRFFNHIRRLYLKSIFKQGWCLYSGLQTPVLTEHCSFEGRKSGTVPNTRPTSVANQYLLYLVCSYLRALKEHLDTWSYYRLCRHWVYVHNPRDSLQIKIWSINYHYHQGNTTFNVVFPRKEFFSSVVAHCSAFRDLYAL